MSSTALGATNKTENGIMFKSNAHEKFYYEKLKEVQYQDEYHMALCYCLGTDHEFNRSCEACLFILSAINTERAGNIKSNLYGKKAV